MCIWDFNSACENYNHLTTQPHHFEIQNTIWYYMPVSYTHLDVYKRQLQRRALMNEVMRQEKKYAINLADGSYLRARLGGVMIQDAHNCLLYTSSRAWWRKKWKTRPRRCSHEPLG